MISLLVANGPSLNDVPLEFLQKYLSYGINGIFLLEGFTPSSYFTADTFFIENNWDEIEKMAQKTTAWVRWPFSAKLGYRARPLHRKVGPWSFDPMSYVALGGTVMYQIMQVAYWHKVQTLLIVGLDHDYFDYRQILPKHFHDDYIRSALEHPQYQADERIEDYGNLQKTNTEAGYTIAREIYEHDGRRIINLTEDSQCDIFERGHIRDW